MSILLEAKNIKAHFNISKAKKWPWSKNVLLKAVNDISLKIKPSETIGIVGESGCGKSTFARSLIGLVPMTSGELYFNGQQIDTADDKDLKNLRKDVQMIFQDPLASLNPRMTIGNIIAEPLRNYYPHLSQIEITKQVQNIMTKVGLLPNVINRYPHEFSGGQCQRVGIARALILKPKLIICDEPVSALDVSIQAQVINMLKELQQKMGLALIFIAHDLAIVRHISDQIMVMYLGNLVEASDTDSLYNNTLHPYSKALLSAVPIPDPKLERSKKIIELKGELPSPINPPSGCVFNTRCSQITPQCSEQKPPLIDNGKNHLISCFNYK